MNDSAALPPQLSQVSENRHHKFGFTKFSNKAQTMIAISLLPLVRGISSFIMLLSTEYSHIKTQ